MFANICHSSTELVTRPSGPRNVSVSGRRYELDERDLGHGRDQPVPDRLLPVEAAVDRVVVERIVRVHQVGQRLQNHRFESGIGDHREDAVAVEPARRGAQAIEILHERAGFTEVLLDEI